jgi:hypothetical protein
MRYLTSRRVQVKDVIRTSNDLEGSRVPNILRTRAHHRMIWNERTAICIKSFLHGNKSIKILS